MFKILSQNGEFVALTDVAIIDTRPKEEHREDLQEKFTELVVEGHSHEEAAQLTTDHGLKHNLLEYMITMEDKILGVYEGMDRCKEIIRQIYNLGEGGPYAMPQK